MCTVGIQERAGKIYDLFSSPGKSESWLFRHNRHLCGLQIFFCCISHKCIGIFWINNHCHTLLGFRDCNLRSVQAGIFLRHFVQINFKAVCQLSDSYRHAACAKVVTLLDQPADFLSAEQSLDLTLGRRIPLLYLRSAGSRGLFCMHFRRARRSAAAVTPGASAKQDDDISRIRGFPDHSSSGRCSKYRPDLHTFCHIIGMIDFFYCSCRQTDLVSVGAVSMSCFSDQFFLRKLSF